MFIQNTTFIPSYMIIGDSRVSNLLFSSLRIRCRYKVPGTRSSTRSQRPMPPSSLPTAGRSRWPSDCKGWARVRWPSMKKASMTRFESPRRQRSTTMCWSYCSYYCCTLMKAAANCPTPDQCRWPKKAEKRPESETFFFISHIRSWQWPFGKEDGDG